ncbi:hypothetical protein CIPAW_05G176900 [Carya illinoinensis]|uniref:Uncharacterized protein n=1 Tax=Carya illinoinensis TaxID=32201 RepID=A0A8T1QLE4_CARIL|nr:hypothetical protein CIPAW_05G176900 [Carya illinoinensis]
MVGWQSLTVQKTDGNKENTQRSWNRTLVFSGGVLICLPFTGRFPSILFFKQAGMNYSLSSLSRLPVRLSVCLASVCFSSPSRKAKHKNVFGSYLISLHFLFKPKLLKMCFAHLNTQLKLR